ncbi:MAG: WG repeat-containing protein [Defluviitaleaceae bacterium]|nr:WG repeat-containing protein [Defluviitaleaceae bacterium]
MKKYGMFKKASSLVLGLFVAMGLGVSVPAVQTDAAQPQNFLETVLGDINFTEMADGFEFISVFDFVPFEDGFRFILRVRVPGTNVEVRGIVDEKGNLIIPIGKYRTMSFLSTNVILVQGFHAVALYDMNGNNILPYLEHEMIRADGLGRGYFAAHTMHNIFIDGFTALRYGNWASRTGSNSIPFSLEEYIRLGGGGGSGVGVLDIYRTDIVDESGRVHMSFGSEYGINVSVGYGGLITVRRFDSSGQRVAVYDVTGRLIVPYTSEYSRIRAFHDGVAIVFGDEGQVTQFNCPIRRQVGVLPQGLINTQGDFIVPIGIYDEFQTFEGGFGAVRSGNLWGFIDTQGNEIVAPQFDVVHPLQDGYWVVEQGGMTGIMHGSGRFVLPLASYEFHLILGLSPDGNIIANRATGGQFLANASGDFVRNGVSLPLTANSGHNSRLNPMMFSRVQPFFGSDRSLSFFANSDGVLLTSDSIPGGSLIGISDSEGNLLISREHMQPFSSQHATIYSFGNYLFYKDGAHHVLRFVQSDYAALTATGSPNTAVSTPNLFTASSWAVDGITQAHTRGLIPANLQTNFTANATRGEFAALAVALYETVTGREITERATFNDTNDINVQKMGGLGVVGGVGDGNFNPNGTITRQEAAVMLARLIAQIDQPLPIVAPTFADNAQIASWATEAVGQIQGADIMGGVGNNQFNPTGNFTREQSIITMLRLLPDDSLFTGLPRLTNQRITPEELDLWIEAYNYLGGINEFEQEVLRLTNIERANYGLNPLVMNETLAMAARFKSQEMANLGYIAHESPVYGNPWVISDEVFGMGLFGGAMAENLSAGQTSPAEAVRDWMSSPGHRGAILTASYSEIGVGFYGNRWTQKFR